MSLDTLQWELGTRDAGAYASFREVVDYLEWLGTTQAKVDDRRARHRIARDAIRAHEDALVERILVGTEDIPGVQDIEGVKIIGGLGKQRREGLLSFSVAGWNCIEIVNALEQRGIRVHLRKNDHYSGNVLTSMRLDSCVRVSVSHYNTSGEIDALLKTLHEILRVPVA